MDHHTVKMHIDIKQYLFYLFFCISPKSLISIHNAFRNSKFSLNSRVCHDVGQGRTLGRVNLHISDGKINAETYFEKPHVAHVTNTLPTSH